MAISKSERAAIDVLLDAGNVKEASALLAGKVAQAGSTAAAAAPAAPAKPRAIPVILVDLFKGIHSLLGNSPALTALIAEFEAAAITPAPAAESTET